MTAPVSIPSIETLVSLKRRVAVITGAAQGIGAAIAARFVEAGASVMLIDRNEAALLERAECLQSPVMTECADVRDKDALAVAATRAITELGGIDIWVNNAGIAPRQPVLEITPQEWDDVMALNLRSALVGSQLAARHMISAARPGVILNMVSSTVRRVSANPAHYRASKLGLLALTQNLAVELGRYGIRVVGIAPTLTDTPLVQSLRQEGQVRGGSAGFDEFVRRLPLRRIAEPDDVARVALFAASDMAAFVTGTVIDVDGGESQK
jgi:NAD(P)-dependent dehydrogenase (short-subunit alcohol dehydrogenase family)